MNIMKGTIVVNIEFSGDVVRHIHGLEETIEEV